MVQLHNKYTYANLSKCTGNQSPESRVQLGKVKMASEKDFLSTLPQQFSC